MKSVIQRKMKVTQTEEESCCWFDDLSSSFTSCASSRLFNVLRVMFSLTSCVFEDETHHTTCPCMLTSV